jgi:hypothetical protein
LKAAFAKKREENKERIDRLRCDAQEPSFFLNSRRAGGRASALPLSVPDFS